ncbi:MAG: hypothetical protein AAF138_06400 [Planctomycetota bacterium]
MRPRSTPLPALLALLVCTIVGLADHAARAAQPTPPRYVAVVSPNVPLRSGDNERFYRVMDLDEAAVLRVVSESEDWLEVAYPPGTTAFVRVQHVTRQGGAVVLTQPRRLRANNLTAGFTGSWKALLPQALPAGTELPIIEEIAASDGQVVGYRVPAPDNATGYVGKRLTRPASDREIDRAVRAARRSGANINIPPADTAPASNTPPPFEPTSEPTPEPTTAPEPQPEPAQPQPQSQNTTAPLDNAPVDQAVPTQPEPSQPEPTQPEPAQPEPETQSEPEPQPEPELPATQPVPDANRVSAESIEARRASMSLEERFQSIRAAPVVDIDVEPLIADYRAELARLGDTPTDRSLARRIAQRLELLELRRDYRNRILELGAGPTGARANVEPANAGFDRPRELNPIPQTPAPLVNPEISSTPANLRVKLQGRLEPSLVYDGDRLPRLFRLVAGGTQGDERTLAYLEPNDGQGWASRLGQVVEIEGVTRSAQEGRVRVVAVETIRVLAEAR